MGILLDRFMDDELFFDYVKYFIYFLDSKTSKNIISYVLFYFKT